MSIYLINDSDLRLHEDISTNVDAKRILVFVAKAQLLDLRVFMGKAFYDDFIQSFTNTQGVAKILITTRTTTAANGVYPAQAIGTTSGSGTNAKFDVTVLNGSVSNITISDPGKGFALNDTLTIASVPGAVFTVSDLVPIPVLAQNAPQAYADLFNGIDYTDKAGHNIQYSGLKPALVYWTFARFLEADAYRFTSTGVVTKSHDDAQPITEKQLASFVSQQRSTANSFANDIEEFLWNNKDNYPLWRYNQRNKNARQPGARIRGVDRTQNNYPNYGYNENNWPFGMGGLY